MTVKKVWIDDGCISCSACEGEAPEVFEVTDNCKVKEGIDVAANTGLIKTAAEVCPVSVIKYEEE